jgi:hypothetical protein
VFIVIEVIENQEVSYLSTNILFMARFNTWPCKKKQKKIHVFPFEKGGSSCPLYLSDIRATMARTKSHDPIRIS